LKEQVFVLSAYETTAEAFFGTLLAHHVGLVLDARLRNESQLCGFTKKRDLAYFVETIAHAKYVHDLTFAPTDDLLSRYIKGVIDWEEYADGYTALLQERDALAKFRKEYKSLRPVCLLGAGTRKRHSHVETLCALLNKAE
jgi:uncharacterized protein YeaO (DUF488 family)